MLCKGDGHTSIEYGFYTRADAAQCQGNLTIEAQDIHREVLSLF